MTRMYVLVAAAWITMRLRTEQRVGQRRRDEAGVNTLELVVIGLGLLGFAAAAVAVFRTAIQSRLDQIK